MKIDILTLFPEMFDGPFEHSIVKRAKEKDLVEIKVHNLRDWAEDKHNQVDDKPYGGGTGMVLMVEPIYNAIQELNESHSARTILLTPQGKVFKQETAEEFAKEDHLIFLAGHYEGIDERVREHLIDEEISIGDYVLTGGELPAMVVTDAIVRLVPGVLEKKEAVKIESFRKLKGKRVLEYPQYTRPKEFKGWEVPEVLLSGDHKKIEKWRNKKSLEKTKEKRPDLLEK